MIITYNGITMGNNVADGNGAYWYVEEMDGWDAAPIRQAADSRTGAHGGFTGVGWYAPRSVVLKGTARASSESIFWASWNALLAKHYESLQTTKLLTVVEGSTTKRLNVQIADGARMKINPSMLMTFEIPMIAPDPFKYNNTATGPTSLGATVSNAGNAPTYGIITFSSSGTNVTVGNTTTGELVTLSSVASGDVLHFADKTFKSSGGVNKYNNVVLGSTTWWLINPGNNTLTISGASGTITYRDAWL